MSDTYDKDTRHKVMQSVKSENTKPEIIVRSLLHLLGYRFRLHRKDLPGSPDLVLSKYKAVVFVNGCFWHQHENCQAAKRPQSNSDYWNKKLDKNVARDKKNIELLLSRGWRVLIIWECQIKNKQYLINTLLGFLQG